MELSTYVYNERKKRHMTQDNLSKLTGISMSEVCRIERGTRNNPSLSALRAIAKAFGKTVAEVVSALDDNDSQCEGAKILKGVVEVDVNPGYARISLKTAGYDVDSMSDEEVCELAVRRNNCYAVTISSVSWNDDGRIP